jgi:hypothetical protein
MRAVAWMVGVSLVSWLAIVAIRDDAHPEALVGMLGPLAAVCATWIAVVRTHAAAPERLTTVLMAGFALKMLFFGAYVAVMLVFMDVRPTPFVASFTGYFIALYAMEALFLKRLLTAGARLPRRGRE